jgi:PiT family inorganic phosphate transporter
VGTVLGFNVQRCVDTMHYFSAGCVGFARGMNDAPKIVALILATAALPDWLCLVTIAMVMAVGALLNAKNVAETMSRKITPMNHGQGFTANLVTSTLVLIASFGGLPVSTTHCCVGSLFGIGMVTGKADLSVIRNIVLSWVLTLPCAGLLSAGLMFIFSGAA